MLFRSISFKFDSIWLRKSSLFSLLVELIKFKISKNGFYPNDNALKNKLLSIESKILDSKTKDITENEYAKYYYYTFQGTTSRNGRVIRGDLISVALNSIK